MSSPARETPSGLSVGPRTLECVEVYIPKTLEHLSELYSYLRDKLTGRDQGGTAIDGFSLYEVDGAFHGKRVHQERTLVIRILFTRSADDGEAAVIERVMELGREIATTVALQEEELWICHYPQGAVVFRPTAARPPGVES